ncbi:hypothetical protein ABZ540_23605 [Nocardia xishanensis]|uniref:hypothetical protein n=1 Tax=Nocardia xishanensis TaxID=238964 RepID=UPI0033FA8CC6
MRIGSLPEPALVRSVLVAITGLVAFFLGREIDTAWIESVLIIYGLLTPVLAGLVIRPAVTPIADRTASDE